MQVAKGIKKHSKHDIDIAFWWYKTKYHEFEPDDFDINYIHSGAAASYPERMEWLREVAPVSRWILGYRGASAMRKLRRLIQFDMWGAFSCSNVQLPLDLPSHVPAFVCHAGVDTEIFNRKPFPEEFTIVWAGTPHAGAKNFSEILELIKLFPYKLAGPNRKADPWADIVTGYKPHQMPDFYSMGTVYVMTSDREGSPLPPKEAAAMGRPVVARKAGDLEEWMPAEYLTDTWQEMVPIIERLRDDPAFFAESSEIFYKLAQKMDYKYVVHEYDRMFDEVLSQ
jgi:glycosyltransferase involved in cell wall biosynthesis